MKRIFILLLLVSNNFVFAKHPPLETVDYVDLDRYLGQWFEIARLPQRFQKGCTATRAIYSMRNDGGIKVLNSCHLESPTGKLKEAEGRAWVKNKVTNAKLKVQFFLKRFKIPFLAGDYWILDLGYDYEYAVIGDPSRKYFWILSRTKFIDNELYDELIAKAKSWGFDVSKIIKTQHSKDL